MPNHPPFPLGYEPCLEDAWKIADYIEDHSGQDVDKDLIREMFHGCGARLVWIELASLKLEQGDHHIIVRKRQKLYDQLPQHTVPPLLVEDGTLKDGYHRLRAMNKRQVTHWWAYQIEAAD